MKIVDTTLHMRSAHASLNQHEIRVSLRAVARPATPPQASAPTQTTQTSRQDDADTVNQDPRLNLLRRMLEALTGQTVRVFDPSTLAASNGTSPDTRETSTQPAAPGLVYERTEMLAEEENTHFSARGQVVTSDGREIAFSVEMNMTRSHLEISQTRLSMGATAQKVDPLIINFNGTATELSDQRFAFDLDADGDTEQIARPVGGSGFLAFDRDGDGRIRDGRELFGPQSGNGFAELAALDDDGNGWIDEGDQAYQRLRIWQPGMQGTPLTSLSQAGVGAISTQALETPFSIKTTNQTTLGAVANTGIFLHENGQAGTIQHIDLTV